MVTDCIPLMKVACHDQRSLPGENTKTKLKKSSQTIPCSICAINV